MAARLLLALAVVVAAFLASAPRGADALRSLGVREGAGAAAGADGDAAVDLNATNFDAFLKASPESFAVVEFFAHWCPACRNYKPHYEKVAKLFNGPDAAHPGITVMARVDCASKVNADLCSRFSVDHYPFLLWGPPTKFASAQWKPKQDNNEIELIDDGRTAERLLKWINKKMGSSFSLDDKKYENESMLPKNASDPEQIARAIYDVEESTAHALQIILEHKMIKPETRDSLVRFLQILVAHHPSKRHFYEMCSSVSVPFKSSRDLALWLWSTHNKVNERLMKEEKELGTGDPSFPKVIWPPRQLCPSCYHSSNRTADGDMQVDWNEDEVFQFLVSYYGKMLVSSYKETYMESLLQEKKQAKKELELKIMHHCRTLHCMSASEGAP